MAAYGSVSNTPSNDPALIHRMLPDELLHEVTSRICQFVLSMTQCVMFLFKSMLVSVLIIYLYDH